MSKLRDSEIEQWVLRELSLSNAIGSRQICVLASDGVVTLQGTVDNFGDKVAATRAALIANGVLSVANVLTNKNQQA